MKEYSVIGIMSGTSLDGVDLAHCYFSKDDSGWKFEIRSAETISYSREWKEGLSTLNSRDALTIVKSHTEYGSFLGGLVKEFVVKNRINADFVSSHGHTIFHQPQNGFTFQLGDGAALSAACGLPVVCDFRSKDVALGGQGAPLVPIGDKLLFTEYEFCLNLGGIANISFDKEGERIAFDVSPCNIVLNSLAEQLDKEYDEGGKFAQQGKVNEALLRQLNAIDYYGSHAAGPKSLGREDVDRDFFSNIHSPEISVEDKLRTFCEHVAVQISEVVNRQQSVVNSRQLAVDKGLLATGGGAFNKFLVSRIKELLKVEVIIPEKKIINFKEALIFAFLGVLRWRNEVNCLKSVTGASRDNCGGAIYL